MSGFDAAAIMGGLYGDGIIGFKRFLARICGHAVRGHDGLFAEARQGPGGALPRGPERWYVETQPERIRGFVEIATIPGSFAACEAVLTKDYRIVEIGFDIPFPAPPTSRGIEISRHPEGCAWDRRRLNSLAFNPDRCDTRPNTAPSGDRAWHHSGDEIPADGTT